MNKVYLLLRSNQQKGPFSLDELLQFDLQPHDLVWIEGRSAGWYYPQEIDALRPHLSFLNKAPLQPIETPIEITAPKTETPPKKIFVSMPSGNAMQKEPPPQPLVQPAVQEIKPAVANQTSPQVDEVKTTYAKTLEEVETDYMNWAYQKKAKKISVVSRKGVLAAGLLVSAAFASWWLLQPSEKISVEETVVTQTAAAPLANELLTENNLEAETATENAKPVSSKKQKPQKAAVAVKQTKLKTPVREREEISTATTSNQTTEYEPAPVVKETVPATEKTETATTEAPKEKKKLRDKIADLFRKKPNEEEAKPVEEADGRRQSTRREAGSNLAQLVTVRFEIPNDWMMGINGAKATLANRSSETVARAVVEVVYYNDDNDVLARKTITFTNIKSKQSQTASVPDHQTATRLEYNVISAVGMGEPVAGL